MVNRRTREFPPHWLHSDAPPDHILGELHQAAVDFRNAETQLPVLLRSICERNGVKVLRRSSVAAGKAYLQWDQTADTPPLLLLPKEVNLSWDRFCAAHELGHYVLITRYGWHPKTRKDYWRTEVLCDYFARELLVPDAAVRKVPAARARPGMQWCNSLSKRANIPWIQVGKKLTSLFPHLVFLTIGLEADGRAKVTASSLPSDKGRGILILKRGAFSSLVRELSDIARRESAPEGTVLSREAFLGSKLGELLSHLAVRETFVEASSRAERVKLVALR